MPDMDPQRMNEVYSRLLEQVLESSAIAMAQNINRTIFTDAHITGESSWWVDRDGFHRTPPRRSRAQIFHDIEPEDL